MIKEKITYIIEEGFELTWQPIEESVKINKTESGYKVKYIAQDEYCDSPDVLNDNDLFLVAYHRDFCVENKNIDKNMAREIWRYIYRHYCDKETIKSCKTIFFRISYLRP